MHKTSLLYNFDTIYAIKTDNFILLLISYSS